MTGDEIKPLDRRVALYVSISGWLVLIIYLYSEYLINKPDFFKNLINPTDYSDALYKILVFLSPLLTGIVGYVLNNRMVLHREIASAKIHYKHLAAKDLSAILDGLILAFANALDAKSHWTKGHSERVTGFAIATAREMGLDVSQIETLMTAALLHDVGKIGTYDMLLDKPDKLTEEEYNQVKTHPDKGVEILAPIEKLKGILPVIRHHHERYDGNGYPCGLKGHEIPLLARIVCVADSYDAITAERPYKKALSRDNAVAVLKKNAGSQFDPEVVRAFLNVFDYRLNDTDPVRRPDALGSALAAP
jgi:putative nucleotidyltransferase with HDIG domain